MRVLVEPSDYVGDSNLGDAAMLQVALERLSKLWPSATIQVFTNKPSGFPNYGPNVVPLSSDGRRAWFDETIFGGRTAADQSRRWSGKVESLERYIRHRHPRIAYAMLRRNMRRQGRSPRELDAFFEAATGADVIMANGMGGITDAFPEYALELLEVFRLSLDHGAHSAMVGQGIGPLHDPVLRSAARSVLPQIDLICLREEKAGRPVLEGLGVPTHRVLTTGDDAIELAFSRHPNELGADLGVNVRAASYANVGADIVGRIRPVLQEAAKQLDSRLVPVPISRVPGEEDAVAIRQLLANGVRDDHCIYSESDSDGGTAINTVGKVIDQIHRCRAVVTGSYHAAVFALSSGIPAVGLANSDYYASKFEGLADQFGRGCAVVPLSDTDLESTLAEAILKAWTSAEDVRPELLEAARSQVERSREAYNRIARLVQPEIV